LSDGGVVPPAIIEGSFGYDMRMGNDGFDFLRASAIID